MKTFPLPTPPTVPLVVALLGLLLTGGASALVSSAQHERDLVSLQARTRETADAVAARIDACVALLQAGAGLFATDRHVTIQDFRAFTRGLDLRRRYPGVQGLGFSRRVPASALAGTLLEMAEAGTPARLEPPTPREEYHVIVFLEPLDDANRRAIGYDMSTDPVRRVAMEHARDSGDPAASGAVPLVQDMGDAAQAGFLVYVAAYGGSVPPRTLEERRSHLVGYVYAPFRASDVVSGLAEEGMRVMLFDAPTADPAHLVFDSGAGADAAHDDDASAGQSINVAGRTFTIVLRPQLGWGGRRTGWWVWLGGLVMTGLLVGLATVQSRGRMRAERLIAELARTGRELRAQEGELRRLVQEAEAASRLKDDFLATVSHELRTPLQSILGWTSLLRSGSLDEARLQRAVETIDRNARAQAQIVEDVLDVSRITSGRLRLEVKVLELAPIVAAAAEVVRPGTEAKSLALVVETEPGLRVRGDAARLQQVFWNLAANAVKFTPSGGRVSIRCARAGDEADVSVSDSGQGIEPAFLPHVFEAFRQQDQTRTRRHGGLGLGLSIVRQLVELQGGTVAATSAGPGAGSTFTVRLPLATGPMAEVEPDDVPSPEAATLAGLGVLLVDDHEDTRDTVGAMLSGAGARVTSAASAREAWGLLAGGLYDVLVCDIAMPEEDGFAFIARVRELDATEGGEVPAIALTAHARIEERTRCLEAGYQRHLSKPVDIEELRHAVRELAGRPIV